MKFKKNNYRLKQLESTMINALNYCLKYDIDDPYFKKYVSFTYVKLSNDKSYLDVFVDTFIRSNIDEVVNNLNKVKNIFKLTLSRKLDLYKIPEIRFFCDKSIDNAIHINALIDDVIKQ